VPEVVLADANVIEPCLLRAYCRFDDQLEALGLSGVLAGRRIWQVISKAEQTVRSHDCPRL